MTAAVHAVPNRCPVCGSEHRELQRDEHGDWICLTCHMDRHGEGVPGANPLGTLAPGTLRRCDVGSMLVTEPEPVDWLVDGVVARGYLTLWVGREKVGKSLAALAFSTRCAGGGGTIAGIQCAPARVLYVDAENGSREIHRRLRALGLTAADGLEMFEAVGFDLLNNLDELDRVLTEIKPDLLWLDSWRSMWSGDENDSRTASAVLDPLRELIRKHQVGAALLHHASKLGSYRGSTAIGASVENIVEFAKAEGDSDRRRRRLHNSACRFEQEADDRWLRIEADRARGVLLIDECEPYTPSTGEQRASMADRLLAALNGMPTTWAAWARTADVDPKHGTARRARDELLERGLVHAVEGGYLKSTGGIA